MSVTIRTGQISSFANASRDGDGTNAAAFAALAAQPPPQKGPGSSGDTAGQVNAFYQDLLGQDADPTAMADIQKALTAGQSLAEVEKNLRSNFAHSDTAAAKINGFYRDVLGQEADPTSLANIEDALAGGQSLTQMEAGLRPLLAHSDTAAAKINAFYKDVLGQGADPTSLANIENALAGGQSLAQVEAFLRPQFAHSEMGAAGVQSLYQEVAGRAASGDELAAAEAALAVGQSRNQIGAALLRSGAGDAAVRQVEGLYQSVLGRDADLDGLAANEAALAGGVTPDQLRSGLAHSAEAAGVTYWQDRLAAGEAVGDVRADIGRSPEGAAQVQAAYARLLGRPASASEVEGFQAAKWTSIPPGATFAVNGPGMPSATVDAPALIAELGAFVTANGGLTPTVTGPDGQVTQFRNASELAGFALSLAERAGPVSQATRTTYGLTVGWLGQIGQSDIQAAANLQTMAQADGAAGNAVQAYLDSVGAQMAMQIQAMPPGQRHALTQRVALGGQYAADVTVTGDAGDLKSLAGFGYTVVDTDPDRTRLIGLAQGQAADAAGARAADNELLAVLDEAQARVDVAYAGLAPGARTDKMLGVAQQFVDAGRGAAAANNWNLVQTFETAADVSLRIAAQPEGSRTALTERFMHKDTKHDITVDPNSADPFATFKDHSKGQDAVGAIVQGVVGVVVNLATLIPGSQAITVPLAVAWDAGQAGKNLAAGNILSGFLNLGAAAGVGLVGLGAASQAGVGADAGSFATDAGKVADGIATSFGFTSAQAAANAGMQVLQGTALVGGLSGVAQSAAKGDPLGVAAGVLEAASAVAGGLVSTGTLTDPAAREFARRVSVDAGLASVGASSADAFAHGDLAGGLLASLNALLTQIAAQVGSQAAPATPTAPITPALAAPGGDATGPFDGPGVDGDGPPGGASTTAPPTTVAGAGPASPATPSSPGDGAFDGPGASPAGPTAPGPANLNPILSDSDGATRVLPDGTLVTSVGYTLPGGAATVEVAASVLVDLAATPAGRAVLAAAGVVLGPEAATVAAVGGTVLLGTKAVQVLVDQGVLPSGPTSQTNVAGYDGTVLGRQSLGIEVDPRAGTGVLFNALGPGGTPLPDGHGAQLFYDAATGALTGADGAAVGRFADGRMVPAPGVNLPALVRSAPLIAAPPSPWGDGVLADPIPPPVPTSPPPLAPPQVDSLPEALVPPTSPSRTGDGGFTATPVLPGIEQGPSADTLDSANIMAVSTTANADGGYDVQFKYKPGWTDAQKAAADAKVAALNDATPTTGVSVEPRNGSAASTYRSAGKAIPPGSDVDHTLDLQLGGRDSIENMAPLDQSVNRSLGAQLNQAIRSLPNGTRLDSFSITD